MKKVIFSFCLIVSMVMWGESFAQTNTANAKQTASSSSYQRTDSTGFNEWVNPIDRFVGVWSLERSRTDSDKKMFPGTFMVVHPDGSYTIFVHTGLGAVITSQGNIIVDSSDVYVEVISHHVNNSLVGVSNRIDYEINSDYLHKSFYIEKDKYGDLYGREVEETWKRAKMPVKGEFNESDAFPI